MSAPEITLEAVLSQLEKLVAMDTRNPPRRPADSGLMTYLTDQLNGFSCSLSDHGDGCLSLLAVRGEPQMLINVHMDTVPAEGWDDDPLQLRVERDRVHGLGACDIKGAAAGLLGAAQASSGDVAFLFTTDEEAGNSTCIREFLATEHGFKQVVVSEPTRCRALVRHRGIATGRIAFKGQQGHASAAVGLAASAVHRAVRWCNAALELGQVLQLEQTDDLPGVRLNLGRIEGGIKPNMIAPHAEVRFGTRPPPGVDGQALLERFRCLAAREDEKRDRASVTFEAGFVAQGLSGSSDLAARLGLELAPPADFWTEAPLFAQSGIETLVFGPGDIAQAHTVDEWVAADQLVFAANTYLRWINEGLGP